MFYFILFYFEESGSGRGVGRALQMCRGPRTEEGKEWNMEWNQIKSNQMESNANGEAVAVGRRLAQINVNQRH